MRKEKDLPKACNEWGWKYHHLGIPTKEIKKGEKYIPVFKFFVSGFANSPFGVEWMRFEEDSPMHPLIQQLPHLAFVVKNLEEELEKHAFKLLSPLNSPMKGIKVAMIELDGAPIELMEFSE